MNIGNTFKKVVSKVKGTGTNVNNVNEKTAEDKKVEDDEKGLLKIEKWQNKLNLDMSAHNTFRSNASLWDSLYNGTKTVFSSNGNNVSNQNSSDVNSTHNARQVVNIVAQLIEAQIDPTVLKPSVSAVESEDAMDRRKMIEGMLNYFSEGSELERIVSENERIVKKNGLCAFKVYYNPDFKARTYMGRIETINPHPCNIIPQKGIYRVKDMDRLFHIENRTIDQLCRKYGEEFRTDLEDDGAEYEYIEYFSTTNENGSNSNTDMISVVEAWYKDKDSDVGLFVWAGETILKDMPKFFYKRDDKGKIITTEEVEIEIPSNNVDQATGQPIMTNQLVTVECKVSKSFPFVIWYNIPREKSFYGKADPEIIADQQEGIKKMLSMEEEKQIKGTTKIFVRSGSGLKNKLTNAISQIIETDDPSGDLKVVDLKTSERSLIELYQIYLQAAKDVLGVTEASQGRADSTTLSGVAIETLSKNTDARMGIKKFEKQIAFRELYKIYYDFILAYYDDKIPYRVQGSDDYEYGYFDKGKLLKQDASGEYYYPDFDIYINADEGLPKDKNFIMQVAQSALQQQAILPSDFWLIMDSIGYPNASFIYEKSKEREQQAQQQAQQAQQGQATSPNESVTYKDLPPEGQVQMALQAGIKLTPEMIMNHLQNTNNMQQQQKMQQQEIQNQPQQPQTQPQAQPQVSNEHRNAIVEAIKGLPIELQHKLLSANPETQSKIINGLVQK